jgi:hypothetical protein
MRDGSQHIGKLALDLRPRCRGRTVNQLFDLPNILGKFGNERVKGRVVVGHDDVSV